MHDVHARQPGRQWCALASRGLACGLLPGIGCSVALRWKGYLVLPGCARGSQHLRFVEQVRLARGLFGARAEVPLAQQHELLVQVVDVPHRVFVGLLDRLLNALIDRLLMRCLLGMQQRLQRLHIVRQLRRQWRQRRHLDFR